jgi:hypothetical protein
VARVSPVLARAIDRLSRRAHRFHRFAHHPLCSQYAGELVRLGRRGRVCRGCLHAVLGCLAGAALALSAPITGVAHLLAALGLTASLAAFAAIAPAGERASKLGTRCAPLAGVSFLFFAGLRLGGWLGAASALVAAFTVAAAYALYRRRGPDRSPCVTCPERSQPQVCRGFAPIVRRERALQRVAQRWLAAAGH